jgi:hypothetical protein
LDPVAQRAINRLREITAALRIEALEQLANSKGSEWELRELLYLRVNVLKDIDFQVEQELDSNG